MMWVAFVIGLMIGGIAGYCLAALMLSSSLNREDDDE